MILYNMRYRGPYEYNKFVLNTFQIANAINLTETNEFKSNQEQTDSLKAIEKNIDEVYNNLFGTSTEKGLVDIIYEQSFIINGGK